MTDAGQPAGWYPAEGDPPGTQRYWDGTQWQGGPQPIGGMTATAGGGPGEKVEYGTRAVAFLIDTGIYLAIYVVTLILGSISDALGLIGSLAQLGFSIYNGIYLQGTTGQTIGKKQQGIKLVADATGQPVGMGMAFVRGLLGLVFFFLCLIPLIIDYLFPLFGDDRKRLTDKILSQSVVKA